MPVTCPVCGTDSERIYRCENCGKDLVDETETDTDLVTDGGQPQSVDELAERAVHPDELDADLATLLARTDFDEYPYRHPDRLARAWEDAASITALAEEFDSATRVVGKWLHVWGIHERSERRSLADQLHAAGGAS